MPGPCLLLESGPDHKGEKVPTVKKGIAWLKKRALVPRRRRPVAAARQVKTLAVSVAKLAKCKSEAARASLSNLCLNVICFSAARRKSLMLKKVYPAAYHDVLLFIRCP